MKNRILCAIAIITVLCLSSCSKKDGGSDGVSPATQTDIKIGSTAFHPTSTKALNSSERQGYDIVLTDHQTSINLSTSTKEAGTYTACNTCRIAADSIARTFSGNLTFQEGEYAITGGILVLSVNADGSLNVSFTFEAIDNNNNVISVNNGEISNLGIVSVSEEEVLRTILMSKIWYITDYEFNHVSEVSRSGNFVTEEIITGTSENVGACVGTYYIKHAWEHYQAKFTASQMIGIYKLTEKDEWPDSLCYTRTSISSKSDTRNKIWSYNASAKTLTADFGNMFDAGVGTEADFSTVYDIISYSSGKIILEGTKYGNEETSFYGRITLE